MHAQVPLIVPLKVCKNHAYIYDMSTVPCILAPDDFLDGARTGFDVDAEFKEHPTTRTILDSQVRPRQGVTGQISGILNAPAMIFAHPDHEIYASTHGLTLRHPVMRSGALFIDYLQAMGEDISLRRCEHAPTVDSLPPFQVDLYAFFALAENTMVFTDAYKDDMRQLAIQGCITQQRRLTSRDIIGVDNWQLDYVRLNAIVTWNRRDYGLRLRWIDVGALHGVASYRDLLVNTGLPTEDKDWGKDSGMITKMDEAYFLFPQEYDDYALGDLHIYKALKENVNNFARIHTAIDLHRHFKVPHLTIGRTIATMFEGTVLSQFGVDPDDREWKHDTLHNACHYGTAEYYRKRTLYTSAVLAKVIGGRVGAHRIILASLDAPWCDLDLASCYGNGLRMQDYAFGRPMVTEYEVDSAINTHDTLRQWLHKRHYGTTKNELVPGLWLAYVSLKPDTTLTYPQTFFASWFGFNAKGRSITLPPPDEWIIDLQDQVCELAVDSGNVKIFTHTIDYAALGHNGLEWILYACDPQQRDELLDHLYVMSAAYYKRSERVPTIAALQEAWQHHQGQNTCDDVLLPDKHGKPVTTQLKQAQECYAWTSKRLDTLLVDQLLANRELYPKKTPLNTLFKLITNGLFGDLVSPYFAIGNVIVGGNITERGRAACWYCETSFNGVQSITDGTQLNLNEVTYLRNPRRKRLTMRSVYPLRLDHNLHEKNIVLRPLGGYDRITLDSEPERKTLHRWKDGVDFPITDTLLDATTTPPTWSKHIDAWINPTAMTHMQSLWDTRITVLHQPCTKLIVLNKGSQQGPPQIDYTPRKGVFEFEMKDVYTRAAFSGAANHLLWNAHDSVLKARSYHRTRRYDGYRLENGVLVPDDRYAVYNPPTVFLTAMLDNPRAIPRGTAYAYLKMIKPDELRIRWKTLFQYTPLSQGDSYCVPGLLREYSHSQFRFRCPSQWKAVEQEYMRCKKRFGQYVECFFLNADGTLDYLTMIREVQKALEKKDTMSLIHAFDPNDHFTRHGGIREHPAFLTLQTLKARLHTVYHGDVDELDLETLQDDDRPLYSFSLAMEQ
jgi:hypothetical protein